jgi:hypothetical protein
LEIEVALRIERNAARNVGAVAIEKDLRTLVRSVKNNLFSSPEAGHELGGRLGHNLSLRYLQKYQQVDDCGRHSVQCVKEYWTCVMARAGPAHRFRS